MNLKLSRALKRPRLYLLRNFKNPLPYAMVIDLFLYIEDFNRIFKRYRERFGKYPNILNPKTFNEYLQREKLKFFSFSRKNLADKVFVKYWVAQLLDRRLTPIIYWSGTNIEEGFKEVKNNNFVVKASHAWNATVIVKGKSTKKFKELSCLANKWLNKDYSLARGERHYRWINPQIIFEELVEFDDGSAPLEFNFFCFHGRPEIINFHKSRFEVHESCFLDTDLCRLNLRRKVQNDPYEVFVPSGMDEMIKIAKEISNRWPFVRIDFLYNGNYYLNEITFFPAAGLKPFLPDTADQALGMLIRNPELTIDDIRHLI